MTAQTLIRPAAQPSILGRIFTPASAPAPANDTAERATSLIVRRRERIRRRDAR